MSLVRYDISVLDNVPRLVSGASIFVYPEPTTPSPITPSNWGPTLGGKATLFQDSAASVPLTNPFQVDTNGRGFFYAVAGLYTVVSTGGTLAAPVVYINQNLLLAASGGSLVEVNGAPLSDQTLLNLVQGSNVTLVPTGGNVVVNATASVIALQVAGAAASSQVLQNLIAGTGMTITDGGGGAITFRATGGVSLKVNGTAAGSQVLLNLKSSANTTIVDDGVGGITIGATLPIFQANATPLTAQGPINFINGANLSVSNPSAGVVKLDVTGLAATIVQSATTLLTTAQLLALKTTPVQLVAAQGAGTLIVPLRTIFEFVPATVAYATVSTADLAVYADTTKATDTTGDSTGLLDQTAKCFEYVKPAAANFFTTDAHSDNKALMIANVGAANYTAGDGGLNVTVYYTVQAVV